MVFIKRIHIRNFKSFGGEPIKLNFQPGFNIITGPNGSGKSNILDAVQFVLGELGSKRMRTPDLSGLIYDGAGEELAGRAQVTQISLYFDNSDRGLPIDRTTVSVGRKMDRKGKSEYFLNGKRTSRRQVLDLLEMAGINPGGYNIVLQGTATRLSDLTPSERMNALQDLVGITEYDNKKADAKIRLSDAERKIEVAQAQIGEIKRQVNDLEKQRNNAITFNLLDKEENRLSAYKLSSQLEALEGKLEELSGQIKEREDEIQKLEEDREKFTDERAAAQQRLDEYNKEAAERGNTQLPMLKSEQVGKNTLKESMVARLREIEGRKLALRRTIMEKEKDQETARSEISNRNSQLAELNNKERATRGEMEKKQRALDKLNEKIQLARETAEQNQRLLENLTESLVPMQESLTGIDTELNKHILAMESIKDKIMGYNERKESFNERRVSLEDKIKEYDALKEEEAIKLEDMIQTVEDQVKRQRNIRSTIENANQLAKDAETTITEFSAKRDLWANIVTEEKALARIREIGEAGAMEGYHGPLRGFIRIDLPHQRAADCSANGWINAVVVDDIEIAKEHVERLKKNKLGMTRFIPLDGLREPEELPDLKIEGVIGAIPKLIRYDELYASVVHLLWGDTFIVEDPKTAELVVAEGYRAVTKMGDVFEPRGGIIGGYYRRPPDWSKLIPSEESMGNLSTTIKDLRGKLNTRMKELRTSGFDLRKFTEYMEDSQERVKRIEDEKQSTLESITRLDYNMGQLMESIEKAKGETDNEERLQIILGERKQRTIDQIEETKKRIKKLREIRLSDVAGFEVERNTLNQEIAVLEKGLNELENDKTIQTSLVDRILSLKIDEAEHDIMDANEEIMVLVSEGEELDKQLVEINSDIEELDKILSEVTSEVEATSHVYEQHQRTLRQINNRLESINRRRIDIDRRIGNLTLEKERIRLQAEQKLEELARLGFSDKVEAEDVDIEQVDRRLGQIKREKRGLGAINQLAIDHYHITMQEYKQRSTRINGMEEEKQSILRFIDEVEREKQDHFMTAYLQICENFSSIFSKLTGGGDGQLELQNPEDPFSEGVDLYIQFPGKPMRLATGASGGERSVAAIAYLLAIQRFLKAPFYLFDEIDAHLDDLNTSRLAEVLKENSVDGQFLMISLKDVMVHNADRIYGVFSQNGCSRVLALPMKEAKVAA
ncbi:MAG: chromosome segregation protein SMC [Candidatus Bathyarchaeota archaeon]|nr:chromosome segregation protein SMC [Candidatus Bathyarchaeota archaeon]